MIPLLLVALFACGEPSPVAPSPPSGTRPADVAPPATPPAAVGLGRAPTADEIAAWDIDVDARGRGLPPGRGTATEGAALYAARCAPCHGASGEGGMAPRLVAREPVTGFGEDWKDHPRAIGNWWPYATTIFDYVRRAMPQTQPGSLTADETYALVAWLLVANGVVEDGWVADPTSLPAVEMPTRVRFVADDREATADFR